jgi:beta-lactam-binding protein with PASTA domain
MHQRTTHLGVLALATVLAIGPAGTTAYAQLDSIQRDSIRRSILTTPAAGVGGAARPIRPGDPRATVPPAGSGQTAVPSTSDGPPVLPQTPEVAFAAPAPCGDTALVRLPGRDTAVVPNVVGLDEADAHDSLARRRLLHSSREVPSHEPTGTVFAQAPPAGTRVALGSRVMLCWAGPGEVPDVVHLARDRAIRTLKDAGYEPVARSEPSLETASIGKVASQNPRAHTNAATGTPVTIVVAVTTMVPVPPVERLSVAAAESTLAAHHLWGRRSGADTSDQAIVRSQVPRPPDSVAAWSRVDLVLAVPAVPPDTNGPIGEGTGGSKWPWKTLLAIVASAAAVAGVYEASVRLRVRALQVVPVCVAGSQTLRVHSPGDELRRRGFELRPVLDEGTQSLTIEHVQAGKEGAGV